MFITGEILERPGPRNNHPVSCNIIHLWGLVSVLLFLTRLNFFRPQWIDRSVWCAAFFTAAEVMDGKKCLVSVNSENIGKCPERLKRNIRVWTPHLFNLRIDGLPHAYVVLRTRCRPQLITDINYDFQ